MLRAKENPDILENVVCYIHREVLIGGGLKKE